MLLQELRRYADQRMEMPPVLYSEGPMRYILELAGDGRLLSQQPIDTADPANPRMKRGQRRLVPQVQRTSIKPLLLADKADYTLGLARDDSERQADLARSRHEAYMELLDRCAAATSDPAVLAVRRFLQTDPLSQLRLPADFDATAIMTFRVEDKFVIDLPSVQAFWANVNDPAASGGPASVMQCLICGERRPALERMQEKIKGVRGGQAAGTAIISADKSAFESYGLKASLIAPVCVNCAERFTKAANSLLADRSSRYYVGGATFIFWTRDPVDFSVYDFLDNPDPQEVRALLESASRGRPTHEVDENRFYACALSASGGRVVVRDWIDTTVGQMQANLAQWFMLQNIVDAYGEPANPLSVYRLAAATVFDINKDLSPLTPRALLRSALNGSPLPMGLLFQAVRRNRAEQSVTPARAGLIKAVLCSQQDNQIEEDRMAQLDSENQNPAYLCGRLLAVLERVQVLAVPGAKATIVDRFYGTASSAPASVFGRLVRGAQPHLGKLQRDNPGAYHALQTRLEDILACLDGYPRTLTLEGQGHFALGYYHQRADDRAQARQRRELREADDTDTIAFDNQMSFQSEENITEEEN